MTWNNKKWWIGSLISGFIIAYMFAALLESRLPSPVVTGTPNEILSSEILSSEILSSEILSYKCVRSLTSLVNRTEPIGTIFSRGQLVFTSLLARDASRLLLVNNGSGNFVLTLGSWGVNRIRFQLPEPGDTQAPRVFYLSYVHGGVSSAAPSRIFEYSEEKPPMGRDELDYAWVHVSRAENLQPHMEYAIRSTVEIMLKALLDNQLSAEQLSPHKIDSCASMGHPSSVLAVELRRKLDRIESLALAARSADSFENRTPANVVINR